MRVKVVLLLLILLAPGLPGCALLGGGVAPSDPVVSPTVTLAPEAYPGPDDENQTQPGVEEGEVGMPIDEGSAVPTETAAVADPTATSEPSETDAIGETGPAEPDVIEYPFGAQIGSPVAAMNFAHPELGCQWQGIAGQVFGLDGNPVSGYVVELGGELAGQPVTGLNLSGLASAYGPGGYEIVLGGQPVASQRTIWIRLMDLQGNQLSPQIYFDTYDDCGRNLVILNFAQGLALPTNEIYLPAINRDAGQE